MTHDQSLNEALKSISLYANMDNKHTKKIIKLILENLMLQAKIEAMRDINEGR